MHILKRIAARLIAYGLLFGGAACNLWGCTEVTTAKPLWWPLPRRHADQCLHHR